jgi:hypothetical protein
MIKYAELVDYIKRNHVNWNTDLFDVLKGFFEEHSSHDYLQPLPQPSYPLIQQKPIIPKDFKEPENGEYTTDDLINLFLT